MHKDKCGGTPAGVPFCLIHGKYSYVLKAFGKGSSLPEQRRGRKQVIEIQDLTCGYGRKLVVKGAALQGEAGECIGIVGANGCGKSTLLSAIAGLRKIRDGSILLDGKNPLRNRTLFTEMIGYVPQDNPLVPELTVKENLHLWYGGRGNLEREFREGFLKVLELDGLWKVRVSRLSGGMKRRLSLACAAAGNPPFLVLDEPGAAVDMVCKQAIQDYLENYLRQKGTVILTSHEENELKLCSRLYVMKDGRLIPTDPELRGRQLMAQF